jgi:hypothetical protein
MDFFIKTEYNIIFIILLVIVSVLISWLFYRKSHLETNKKILFSVLRFLSTLFILLLLSSPVISYVNKDSITPLNIFLIDNSRSLTLENRNEMLTQKVRDAAGTENDISENRYFFFSNGLIKESDGAEPPSFEGINNFRTDYTQALVELQERFADRNISTINIFSDGIVNEGGNPVFTALALNAPVNYMLIGDTIQKNDLVIKDVFYNKTAFIESSVPVNVEINAFNYDKTVNVILYEEDKQIDSRLITISRANSTYNLKFNVSSPSGGVKKYKVEVAREGDEITDKNNYSEFFIKFIDNKFKVLVLAGGPSADFSFISEEIKKIQNFETTFLTQKTSSEFYEGAFPSPDDYQVFMLIGYPTNISNPEYLNRIKESLEKNKSAVLFFESRNTDYGKLALLENLLPFKTASPSDVEEETGIRTVSSLNTEIFNKPELLGKINGFPSIFKNRTTYIINPSAETFLTSTRGGEPVLSIQKTLNNNSAAFLAHGLYKWRLNPVNYGAGEVLNYIITNTVVNITDKEKQKKLFVETTSPVFSKFENVKFTASLNPAFVTGGENIKIRISGSKFRTELELKEINNMYFEGEINVPEDGDYQYTAELSKQGQYIEGDEGRFIVGENNYEYKLTRPDKSILSSLSSSTGGVNLNTMSPGEMSNMLKEVNSRSSKEVQLSGNLPLNINPFYLFGVILLLGLEWFFRKRNNLP